MAVLSLPAPERHLPTPEREPVADKHAVQEGILAQYRSRNISAAYSGDKYARP
jgi:hypothetical protein